MDAKDPTFTNIFACGIASGGTTMHLGHQAFLPIDSVGSWLKQSAQKEGVMHFGGSMLAGGRTLLLG